MTKKIKGYKGYNKNLKCRDFQYEIGKTYEQSEKPKICDTGFHFCEYPLDVFNYYNPADSRFTEVLGEETVNQEDGDSKVSARKIEIGAEIDLIGICQTAIQFTLSKTKKSRSKHATGYQSAASNTGNYSAASNTGNYSAASNTGYQSAASNTGYQSIAVSVGIEGRAMASLGSWITLAEWKEIDGEWNRIDIQTKKVDGKKIKAEVYYQLKDGKFVEYV